MEALLLAGGFGTRIRPLTYFRPKPLLPIANKTLIDRVLEHLPKEVDKVVLPVNYLGELIRAHFEEHPDPRLLIVDEPEPMGTGGAIKRVEDEFSGPFLVYNADIVSSIDLQSFVDYHRAKNADASISLWEAKEPWHFGVVVQREDGRIQKFIEKPPKGSEPSNRVNAGHYVLELSVLDRIPKGKFVSLERDIFEGMSRNGSRLYGFPFQGHWVDCGRPESYLDAQRMTLARLQQANVVGEGVMGLRGARFDSYAIGDGAELGKGATIERSVLLPGVRVGKNVTVRDSILGEGVEVEGDAVLERCVVGDYATIAAGSRIRDQRVGMRAGDE